MRDLHDIAADCGTDKLKLGYINHYQEYFEAIREKSITLLEIGVYRGASLRMWREYFPNARIYGIDISRAYIHQWPGIPVFIGDATSKTFLQICLDDMIDVDIVIDDASHKTTDQAVVFDFLFPKLNPNGIYVCEDLSTSFMPQYITPPVTDAIAYFSELSHKVVKGEISSVHFVNQMVFIKKGN